MRRVEREFYRYGGEADLSQLQADVRVAGVVRQAAYANRADTDRACGEQHYRQRRVCCKAALDFC